jgi:hypothetical protein
MTHHNQIKKLTTWFLNLIRHWPILLDDRIQADIAGSLLSFDAKVMYTFHWGYSKVYVTTHFKFQVTVSLVGIALLTRLGGLNVCLDLLHLLFCLCHNVRTKYNPFARLRPTQ